MSEIEVTDNNDPWFSHDMEGHIIAGGEGVYCPDADGFFDPSDVDHGLYTGDECPVCGDELDC